MLPHLIFWYWCIRWVRIRESQRLNCRRDKISPKVTFKKNYLIFNGSKWFCSKNKKNEAITLYRVFYQSVKNTTGGTRKRQKVLAGIRQIVFWKSLVSMFEILKYVELLCFELFCFKRLQKLYLISIEFLVEQLLDIIYRHNYIDLKVNQL